MKYLRKLAGILFLPILLIILTNCNNTGSNASSSGSSSNGAVAAATYLTVQESTEYGSVGSNSTNVSRHPSIVLVFSAPINKNTVTTNTIGIYAKNSTTGIFDQAQPLTSFYFNNDATAVIFSPVKLASNTEYRVVVSTGVQASSGASLASEFSMAFTTGTSEAPTAALLNPLGKNSPSNTPIQVIYSESGMKGASSTSYVKISTSASYSSTGTTIPISIARDQESKIFTITASLTPGKQYYLYLTARYGSTYYQIYNYTSSGSQIALETDKSSSSYYYKQFGLIESNGSSTTVSMSQPVNGASGVSPSTPIKLVFTNSINVDTLDGQISLHKGSATGEEIPSTFDASTNPTVTVKPTSGALPTASAIYVVVGSGILDSFGHYVTTPSTPFTFTTSDSTSPTLVDVTPADGSTLTTNPNPSISLTFSTNMDSSSVKNPNNTLLLKNGNLSESVPIMITGSGTSYIITPYQTLANNSNYTLLLESAIIDTSGNHLTQTKIYYTTGADKTAPTLKVLNTENGFLSPRTNPHNIQVMFSKPMVGVSESTVTIRLGNCSSAALGTYKMIDNGNNTYTFPLIESLTYQTTSNYYVCLTSAVKDTSGNTPSPNYAEFNTFLYDVNNEIQGYWSSNNYVVESVSTVSTTDQY
ncbi:MAG: hypothetical protein QG673_1123 [Pseudomonadota bacterium]|nr:hypothetical protein [Pseudomonadota bacterium]